VAGTYCIKKICRPASYKWLNLAYFYANIRRFIF